jgi:hypothetical protein
MAKRRKKQLEIRFPGRGGPRPGAGRKPNGPTPMVSHDVRPEVPGWTAVHVTMRIVRGIGTLRSARAYGVALRAFASSAGRFGMRLNHFSVQGNHLHIIVDVAGKTALSKGMQGLSIRIAKRLNRLLGRRGHVFGDRYHARILRTPREVRNALAYVLNNARRHAQQLGRSYPPRWVDPFSSATAFDGWRDPPDADRGPPLPILPARVWLLKVGWRRHGLIALDEVPGPRA